MTNGNASSGHDSETFWRELGWEDEDTSVDEDGLRLRQRAEVYARPVAQDQDAANRSSLLVFDLGKERYGIDVMTVRQVRKIEAITPVPGTPPFYAGVVNVRGQIITALDLRVFFNVSYEAGDPADEMIVVRQGNLELGLLAHRVHDVQLVDLTNIGGVDDIRYARGVTSDRLVVLDVARLLEDKALIVGGLDAGEG